MLSVFNQLIVDGDTLWAIKVGEWIVKNGDIPRCETFSWTACGNPWVAHEWLYDLLIYKFHSAFSYCGIGLMVFIPLIFLMFFIWRMYSAEKKNIIITSIIFIIVIFSFKNFIAARPQVFSYLFFTYFLYVLLYNKKILWTLPLITVLWANVHGSVILGVMMVLLQLTYETAFLFYSERRLSINKKLSALAILVPVFSLINPYGIELWKASLWQITYQMNRYILEWQPPDFKDTTWTGLYIFIIFTTVCICFSTKEIKDRHKIYLLSIYLLGTFFEAMTSLRYFPYLMICWGLFALALISGQLFSETVWRKRIAFLFVCVAVFMVSTAGKLPATIEDALSNEEWPLAAVSSLESRKTFNYYTWGGYLIFKDIPVFIDGRADAYQKSSDVYNDYVNATNFKTDPIEILDKYDVEQVIMPVNGPLDIYLKRLGWAEKYRDETAVIFIRNNS